MRKRALTDADMDILGKLPLFSPFERSQLSALCGHGTVRAFDAPTLLFSAGETADGFFVVMAGQVHLTTLTAEGAEAVVTVIEAGESFAEAAMFGSGRFPVNAQAQPGCEVLRIDKAPLEAALRAAPDLAFRMLDALLERQAFLIAEVSRLKSQTPARRLASFLLALVESGRWTGRGRLPHAKQVIASRIGIDPASLSRALRRLESAGITCVGDEVIVGDADQLRAYCAGGTP